MSGVIVLSGPTAMLGFLCLCLPFLMIIVILAVVLFLFIGFIIFALSQESGLGRHREPNRFFDAETEKKDRTAPPVPLCTYCHRPMFFNVYGVMNA